MSYLSSVELLWPLATRETSPRGPEIPNAIVIPLGLVL